MKYKTIDDRYHLSPLQEGMIFHHVYAKHSGVDIEQIVCSLAEDLDISTLKTAWKWVVARHPSLRASFRWENLDRPIQDIHHEVDVPFEVNDWSDLSMPEQEQRLDAYLQSDRKHGFDLTQAPNMRLALFHLGDANYMLVWTFHHILLDAVSFFTVLREVFDYYEAALTDGQIDLGQPLLYRQHIEFLEKRDKSKDETFWSEALAGFTTPTPLGVATKSVSGENTDRGLQEIHLSAADTTALRTLAKEQGVTLNTLVQGAWALLLSRHSGEADVVFGATRGCRRSTMPGAESVVGLFFNALPVRVQVDSAQHLTTWLQTLREQQMKVRAFEQARLVDIHGWCDVPPGTPLFESIIVFNYEHLSTSLRALGGKWKKREFQQLERTNYPIILYVYAEQELRLKILYDGGRFDDASITRMLGHMCTLFRAMVANPHASLPTLPLLTEHERQQLLIEWNTTRVDYPTESLIHELFEEQVHRTPDAIALVFYDLQLTYKELNERANQLSYCLIRHGVGPDVLVGICLERSIDMVVSILAIHKAGGAYLPLDPDYPNERLAFMIKDAMPAVLLTHEHLVDNLPSSRPIVLCLDSQSKTITQQKLHNLPCRGTSNNLAYVIYTSGSTGKPKGIMIEHRNVINFFVGMDKHLDCSPSGLWLAVTTLSFDISVLELLWTLTRGFRVVLYSANERAHLLSQDTPAQKQTGKPIEFSLFYFANDENEKVQDKYRLLMEGAKFADENGFSAVWTPERHFHAFGGLYPNPSVASAAIAAVTKQVKIRAGSCVLPLHSPIRVAEEWSLVDNLSKGRVGVSFASGWQPDDFVLKPENFADNKKVMYEGIETVRRLWRGEQVAFPGPRGQDVQIGIRPHPVQSELPIWVTAAGNPETFRQAGEIGANLLTHLLGQSVDDLAKKIQTYREARRQCEHAPGDGHVTLMLHTFVADDEEFVRSQVQKPLKEYLRSATSLVKQYASSWPTFKKISTGDAQAIDAVFQNLSDEDMEALLDHSFARYYETSGLFGAPETCLAVIGKLKGIGVDEIACLIDFGVPSEIVLEHLPDLNRLRELTVAQQNVTMGGDYSIPALIEHHGITHLQCTPSMATMLTDDSSVRQELSSLKQIVVGGETFPTQLASKLQSLMAGDILNMYGPTETTIWSSAYKLDTLSGPVSIGRPIANTQLYILDKNLQPVPIGVTGEIYVGGAGLARGYLNQPELTAERFIPNPFSDQPGARLYKTGDLARYRPNGEIDYLGRLDHQVKVRGFRIELGEIEAVLDSHKTVKEGVVIAREDTPGDQRLVAYSVSEPGYTVTVTELRTYLRTKLPEYMIPQHFIELDALPLTPNGKIDRKALPTPFSVGTSEGTYVAPRTETEKLVADIWQDVIGVEQAGIHDNFFELGGHSLLSIQAIARLKQATGVQLSVQSLVANTLEQIAVAGSDRLPPLQQPTGRLSGRILQKVKGVFRGSS